MNGKELALKVIARYKTSNVFDLAQQAGCPIIYEKWHPTTFGEFHKKTNTIYVNLHAPIEKERIIAHELGHFFAQLMGVPKSRMEEEVLANDFAKQIMG